MGLRKERLAEQIRDTLALCFQGGRMQDPRLESVTITAAKVSPDLSIATVYFRVYNDADIDAAQQGLVSASGYLKRELARSLDVRRVPDLRFFYDESIERASRIEELINKIK